MTTPQTPLATHLPEPAHRIALLAVLAVLSPFMASGNDASVETGGLGKPLYQTGVRYHLETDHPPAAQKSAAFFDHGNPSPMEQLMLECINRTRLSPADEAARLGIDLNEGLAPGTIADSPKPPLAFNPLLAVAARSHSQWMLETDTFSHTGSDGTDPGERMEAAGYGFTGAWAWGENIAWKGTTGHIDLQAYTVTLHENLFLSPSHRTNICNPYVNEIGIGLVEGPFEYRSTVYNALMATQNYARSAETPEPLLLGVVYTDSNDNGRYDCGEGLSGVTVSIEGGSWVTTTSSSGGYALPYPDAPGSMTVTFRGDALGGEVSRQLTRTGQNLKEDLDAASLPSRDSYTLIYGGSQGGAVLANAVQTVSHGNDGEPVTATPDPGYRFLSWSDGCSDNPRIDTAVTQDLAVTASFGPKPHDSDTNGDWTISLAPELTRLLQLYNAGEYHIQTGTEDGYAPGPGKRDGKPHDADLNGDWTISLSPELTRLVQLYNAGSYRLQAGTEDGYAPGSPPDGS